MNFDPNSFVLITLRDFTGRIIGLDLVALDAQAAEFCTALHDGLPDDVRTASVEVKRDRIMFTCGLCDGQPSGSTLLFEVVDGRSAEAISALLAGDASGAQGCSLTVSMPAVYKDDLKCLRICLTNAIPHTQTAEPRSVRA